MIDVSTAFKDNVYGSTRMFDSRITIVMNDGTQPIVYDDSVIMNFDVVNELSVVNDTVTSDQATFVLKNDDGKFNFFNMANMQQILSRNPYVIPELGLVTAYDSTGFPSEWEWVQLGKYTITEWRNDRTAFTVTLTCNDALWNLANTTYPASSGQKTGTLYDLACDLLIKSNFQVTNKKGYRYIRETLAGNTINTNNSIVEMQVFNQAGTNLASGVLATSSLTPTVGTLSMITDGDVSGTNYCTIGTGTADQYQIDLGSIHYDLTYINIWHYFGDSRTQAFTLEGSEDGTTWETIYTQTTMGVKENSSGLYFNFKPIATVDASLQNYTNVGFSDDIAVRDGLQNVGIASMCAVYQDRNGIIQIKPFESLQNVTPVYINNAGTQDSFQDALGWDNGHTVFNPYYPELATDIMVDLNLETQWNVPQISLAQQVYQIQITVYDGSNTQMVYNNPNIVGTFYSGESFSIDNELITTQTWADQIATWYYNEMSYNAIYDCDWRQNPALEVADLVFIEDGFNTSRQARINRQEFNYSGTLQGQTEARGGI